MHGLIVKQPHADKIIQGKKTKEYRSREPPKHYLNTPIYLLSEGLVLGVIIITGHTPNTVSGSTWHVRVLKEFTTPVLYRHPNGAQIWVRDVNTYQAKLF